MHTGVDVGCAYLGFYDTDLVRGTFTHPAARTARRVAPPFVVRPRPPTEAVTAIVDGVLRRRRRVWAPRYVGAALALRGIVQPAGDVLGGRRRVVATSPRLLDTSRDDTSPRELLLGVAVRVSERPARLPAAATIGPTQRGGP